MPIVSADWSVNSTTKDIRYIGGDHNASPSYATVIEFHRWLQDLADDASFSGNDEMDITILTPSDRSTDNIITLINGYNIDDTTSEHLYDGSIIQAGGATIYDGIVNFGNTPNIQIIQNGAVLADDWWNSNGGLNSDPTSGISHRFMIKVRTAGADIDLRRLIGLSRQFGKTYSEFSINATSRGNNVFALSESDDLNNQTLLATVAGWAITNTTAGYNGIDVNGDAINEFYFSKWDLGARTSPDLYEKAKWIQRTGSAETLYGLSGELFRGITHEITVDAPTGTFAAAQLLTWSTGTGQLLAINSPTAATKIWMQLLTGSAPADNTVITGAGGGTVTVNVTIVERPISSPFVGASTGSALIGAYGVGVDPLDLTAADSLKDLNNTVVSPPNNVTFTVNGLVIGEDRVFVGPESAGTLNKAQFSLQSTLSGAAVTSVTMTAAIPTDTPASGIIRIRDNSGLDRRISYTSYTGSTFTIASTNFSVVNATAGNNAYLGYIDKLATATSESFTGVYLSDRPLFVRVRDGAGTPIKTFETTGTLGSAGGSTTVIRTSDG